MATYLAIPREYAEALMIADAKLRELCISVETNADFTICVPRGGNLLNVIQLLSQRGIKYELRTDNQ
jgi:hypothetical protein